VAAGSRLLDRLRRDRVSAAHVFSRFEDEEVVLLRHPKTDDPPDRWATARPAELIDYHDSEETFRLRHEVRVINEALHRLTVERHTATGPPSKLDMPSVFLRRVFTRGSFETGGRLWPASGSPDWYSMPSRDRLRWLRIEGEPVAAVDIKSASVAILYAMAGEPLPLGDLYGPTGYGSEHRAALKLAAQCAIFRRRRCHEWPREAMPQSLPGPEAFAALESLHAPILPLLWRGEGHRTQRLESDVLVRTLVARPDLCALPLHDAVYVPQSRAEDAAEALCNSFESVTGGRCRVDIEFAE
jgi:hypothetical protein